MQGRISIQAFLEACANGDLTIVESLLETAHPLDVCSTFRDADHFNMTAIMLAAKNNRQNIVERIIKFANEYAATITENNLLFDFNVIDLLGRNALTYAAEAGHTSICQLLIDNGCDPRNKDVKGKTPDHYAKENGHGETMLLLLNASKKADDSTASQAAMKIFSFHKDKKPASKPKKPATQPALPIQESTRVTRSMTRKNNSSQKK